MIVHLGPLKGTIHTQCCGIPVEDIPVGEFVSYEPNATTCRPNSLENFVISGQYDGGILLVCCASGCKWQQKFPKVEPLLNILLMTVTHDKEAHT